MADVKWIKLATDIFDNRKIRQIECLPEGYAIIVMWLKILCLAGNINDNGCIYLTKDIPYTEQMLSAQFNVPIHTVQLALKTFEQFGMLDIVDDILMVSNWEKYQNIDRLTEIREYNRLAQQRHRAKQKMLDVNDKSITSQRCHDTDIDIDIEEDIDIDIDKEKEIEDKVTCKQVIDLFHSICISYPSVKSVSEARRKAINARLKAYSLEDFEEVFRKAEGSSFLKGSNNRDWSATFDWLMKDSNFAKVLDGNYDNRPEGKKPGSSWNVFLDIAKEGTL